VVQNRRRLNGEGRLQFPGEQPGRPFAMLGAMPDTTAAVSPTPSKAQVFFRRLGSTLLLWTVVLVSLSPPSKLAAACGK